MIDVPASETTALQNVLEDYFDALHHSDAALLGRLFHQDSNLYSGGPDGLSAMPIADYLARVAARPAPADAGHAREGKVLILDISGPATAFAKVSCAVAPMRFVDYLNFVKVDGAWRIIAKIYHRVA
jgi:hypothetical protein